MGQHKLNRTSVMLMEDRRAGSDDLERAAAKHDAEAVRLRGVARQIASDAVQAILADVPGAPGPDVHVTVTVGPDGRPDAITWPGPIDQPAAKEPSP
jgi:hypothetical protein